MRNFSILERTLENVGRFRLTAERSPNKDKGDSIMDIIWRTGLRIINRLRLTLLYGTYHLYFMKMEARKKGECRENCGACCGGCPHLTGDKKCSVYTNRPRWCNKDFPVDSFDIYANGLSEVCTFKFSNPTFRNIN